MARSRVRLVLFRLPSASAFANRSCKREEPLPFEFFELFAAVCNLALFFLVVPMPNPGVLAPELRWRSAPSYSMVLLLPRMQARANCKRPGPRKLRIQTSDLPAPRGLAEPR